MKKLIVSISINLLFVVNCFAVDRGIYLTQNSLENTVKINYFIKMARQTGINTFVIDLEKIRAKYDRNIQLVKDAGLKYVVRIVVFPGGGNIEQIKSIKIREARLRLIHHAERLGASEIQLDYIRYNTKVQSNKQNANDIKSVIQWFKRRTQIPLQIAVFGETTFGPSIRIGQDLKLLSSDVATIAPMLYPSHFEPKQKHSYQPYTTIKNALDALVEQFDGQLNNQVVTYIETTNYRRKMDHITRSDYIRAQLQAVQDAGLGGWYAWSANNQYNTLFKVLNNLN